MNRTRIMTRTPSLALLVALVFTACRSDEAAPPAEDEHVESVVVTQWNDSTELFLEYPFLIAGEATGNWAIHLTDMEDFQPIRSGRLVVRFMQGGDAVQTFTVDDVARDGIFLLDPVVERPGTYAVELELASAQVASLHVLPEVEVHASREAFPHAHAEEDGGIAFLKEQQWQMAFAVDPAVDGTLRRTVEAPGEIVAADGGLVQVSAPVDAIASAAHNRAAPSMGDRVRAGQVLVVLSPLAQDGGFAELRARVERLEREVARAERLYEVGAIALKRLEEARHDLEVASAQAEAMGAGAAADDYLLRLTAPLNGVIARRSLVPGGRVTAGEPLYTVVDPSTVWLRVRVPADLARDVSGEARASFTLEGSDRTLETGRLVSVGSVIDPATRTVPAIYEVGATSGPPAIGQLARVRVPVGDTASGVVIDHRAIVDDNGTPVAYVQAGGESFERRALVLGATDGLRTQVLSGIEPGEMVVTLGGYQVRLASMSGGEFAGGHAH